MNQTTMTLIEIAISLIVEGIILGLIFQFIASKETEKQEQNLKTEMQNLEKQVKNDFQMITVDMQNVRNDILSQIKESNKEVKKC